MNIIWIIVIVVSCALQNACKKGYTARNGSKGIHAFNVVQIFFMLVFFVLAQRGRFSFEVGLLPYSCGYALSFSAAVTFTMLAIFHGPLSLTALVVAYANVIPTLYGLVFLHEPISIYFCIGLVILFVSLILVNGKKESGGISWKWTLFSFLSFLGIGLSATFQKMQQMAFSGAYKNEFMIIALLLIFVGLMVAAGVKERGDVIRSLRNGGHLAAICGLLNGFANLLMLVLAERMSVSLMFPLISAGGIVLTYFISKFIYPEKLTKFQYVGFVAGTVSILFLSL